MTQNQIAYQANLEKERANRAQEAISQQMADETKRSNKAKETETNRTNLAKEKLESRSIDVQKNRSEHQNATDTANAVTGGIGSILKGIGSFF